MLMNDSIEKPSFSDNENYTYSIGTLVASDDLQFYKEEKLLPLDEALSFLSQCISNFIKKALVDTSK
jgi:hypothetical protein